jgi:hypothetical protein
MRQKSLVIGLLVVLAFLVSGFTYAYWAASVTGNQDSATGTITIGQGGVAATVVAVDDITLGTALVPDTQTGTNNVDLIFTVNWAEDSSVQLDGATVTGTLTATPVLTKIQQYNVVTEVWDDVTLPNGATLGDMFTLGTVVYQDASQTITMGTSKTVTVNLLFDNEPASKAIYDAVANGRIIITVTFVVSSPSAS